MAENQTTAAMEIVVDDGAQRVPIKNVLGEEIGVFYFHPTDIAIINRYNDVAGKFGEIVAPLENVTINPDGTAQDNDENAVKAFNEAQKRLYEACDYIFGGNMSEAFFGSMHPFSPVGGEFYCERALEVLGRFITAQFKTETKKISKRLKSYVSKYEKK